MMEKGNLDQLQQVTFDGFPLTDFLDDVAFKNVEKLLQKNPVAEVISPINVSEPVDNPLADPSPGPKAPAMPDAASLYQLFDGVTLAKFKSSVIRTKGRYYVYDIGLNSSKTVGFLLKNPFDTIITFGQEKRGSADTDKTKTGTVDVSKGKTGFIDVNKLKEAGVDINKLQRADVDAGKLKKGSADDKFRVGIPNLEYFFPAKRSLQQVALSSKEQSKVIDWPKKTVPEKSQPKARDTVCDFNVRLVVNEKNLLEVLQIYGPTIQIYFSKNLIKPVRKNLAGKFAPTGNRQGIQLGNRTITLRRGKPPKLSRSLTFEVENNLVLIGGQNIIARLKNVNLGGTFEEPKLIFDQVELV